MKFFGNTARVAMLVAAAIFLLTGATALAAEQGPKLKLNIVMAKEVKTKKAGKELVELVTTDKAEVGDTIVYTITYTNEGTSVAKQANITDPVPANTVYVLDSAKGKDTEVTFSVDGGKTYHKPPVMVKGKDSKGNEIDKPAPAEAYTHVRWVVVKDIQPGKSGQTIFKVKVK